MNGAIGIFGGTFDPVHIGHIRALENFIKNVSPEKLLVIPAGIPPHKHEAESSAEDRINMLRAAVRDIPGTEICLYETEKEGRSYTYDTAVYLRSVYPDKKLVLFVGSDMLLSFASWHRAEELAKLVSFAVFSRSGDDLDTLRAKITELERTVGLDATLYLDRPAVVSSTEIRWNAAEGELTGDALLPVTEAYIRAKGLYGCPKTYDKELYKRIIKERLSEKRYIHSIGVAETAVKYAKLYGADIQKAEIAGLLHDCTKAVPYEKQLLLVKEYGLEVSEEDLMKPIIHSVTAAGAAAHDFGICDPEIISAVRYHSTGRENMTLLDKIIYTADFTEPSRDYSDSDFYRKKAEKNLDEAMFLGMKWIITDKIENDKLLHMDSVKMYNSMIRNKTTGKERSE